MEPMMITFEIGVDDEKMKYIHDRIVNLLEELDSQIDWYDDWTERICE